MPSEPSLLTQDPPTPLAVMHHGVPLVARSLGNELENTYTS